MKRVIKKINASSAWIKDPFIVDPKPFKCFYNKQLVFAWMLADIEKIYNDLKQIRNRLQLDKLLQYPNPPNINSLIHLLYEINDKQREILDDEGLNLAKAIGVPGNWIISLKILVLTHVLPLPNSESFTLYDYSKDKVPPYFVDFFNSPKIIFNTRFTIKGLVDWIKENKDNIMKINDSLPKKPERKNELDTLILQQIVFTLKEYEGKTSKQIENLLPIIYKKHGERLPIAPRSLYYKVIDDLHNSYKKHLASIYKTIR